MLCDAQRMPIRIGSQTKLATVGRGHYSEIPDPKEQFSNIIIVNISLMTSMLAPHECSQSVTIA